MNDITIKNNKESATDQSRKRCLYQYDEELGRTLEKDCEQLDKPRFKDTGSERVGSL